MGELVGEVRVTPAVVRPWEPVHVEVLAPDGSPPNDVEVWIDRSPGAAQWLQLPAGTHRIRVLARSGDRMESADAEVTVAGEPLVHITPEGAKRPPVLCAHAGRGRPYELTLVLSTPPPPRRRTEPDDPRRRPDPRERPEPAGRSRAGATGRLRLPGGLRERVLRSGPAPTPRSRRMSTPSSTSRRHHFELHTDPARRLDDETRRAIDAARASTGTGTVYRWDFGDGTTATTDVPSIVHDYTGRFDLRSRASSFDVRCRVERAGDAPFEVVRTLVLDSWYAACRSQGRIICPVESATLAVLQAGVARGRFTVSNPEDQALTFDRIAIAPLLTDDRGEAPSVRDLADPVVVQPTSSVAMAVLPELDELPDEATGYTVLLAGSAADGTPARATAVVELPLQRPARSWLDVPTSERRTWPWEEVTHRLTEGLRGPGTTIRGGPVVLEAAEEATVRVDQEIGLLAVSLGPGVVPIHEQVGLTRQLHDLLDEAVDHATAVPRKGSFPPTDPVAEGGRCDPSNIPAPDAATAAAASLACQLAEQEEVRVSGRFVNARKGDIVLSAAGVSPMAQIYHELDPPQDHSHAGIMTRNHDQIAHCIGSGEWLEARLSRSSQIDGLPEAVPDVPDPDLQAIRFGWPGAVLQHAEDSVEGETFLDPEGAEFTIAGIQPYDIVAGSLRVVPPLVVKPDPLLETPALRARLHGAADDAAAVAGRPGGIQSGVHFSFFTFTNGAFAAPAPTTADGTFPSGTLPGACSTFIWRLLRGRGVVFEQGNLAPGILQTGDLEPGDVAVPVEVVPGGIDGLYFYDALERVRAGSLLKARLVHEVSESHWGPDELTDGAAGAIVDLFLNVMAFNSIEIGERWREQPTTGQTVSPDDIRSWDGPATGGSYGFVEPLLYREPRTEMVDVYRWTKFERTYRVTGQVLLDGKPVPGAHVTCGAVEDFTDATGRYELPEVAEGKQRVKATATEGSTGLLGESGALMIDSDRVVDIVLKRPADERRRKVDVVAVFFGIDGEMGDDDLHSDSGMRTKKLNPDAPTKSLPNKGDSFLTFKWGGECRAEYQVDLSLLADLSVRVDVHGDFFEGTYEDTTELEASFDGHIIVPKDSNGTATVILVNAGVDLARLDLDVFNDMDPVQ